MSEVFISTETNPQKHLKRPACFFWILMENMFHKYHMQQQKKIIESPTRIYLKHNCVYKILLYTKKENRGFRFMILVYLWNCLGEALLSSISWWDSTDPYILMHVLNTSWKHKTSVHRNALNAQVPPLMVMGSDSWVHKQSVVTLRTQNPLFPVWGS